MIEHAVEAIRPHGAALAGGAHVVDDEQRVVPAEQLGQPRRPGRAGELVVFHFLGLDRGLLLTHLAAQLRNLATIAREPFSAFFVAHPIDLSAQSSYSSCRRSQAMLNFRPASSRPLGTRSR